MVDLLHNRVLIAALLGWFVAQGAKVVISIIKTKKFDPERLNGAGGMPSSHSCMVTALTVSIAMTEGMDSAAFALAVIFTFVTLYDAMGVRWQAGLHARMLNKYMREIFLKQKPADEVASEEEPEGLKEYLGHRPIEVLVGVLLGILIAMAVCLLIPEAAA